MIAWLPLVLPLILELLKLFFGGNASAEAKEAATRDLLARMREINAALKKAEETDSTQDLEDIVNGKKK